MSKRDYIGALIASCVSVFAYQTGFFFFLFLVPLQLLLFRRGLKVARIAVLGVGIALVYLGIRHTALGNGDVRRYLLLVELVIPFLLLGGFLLENGYVGFASLVQTYAELEEHALVRTENTQEKEFLIITEEGRESLYYFGRELFSTSGVSS